jgi:hypothetical protein
MAGIACQIELTDISYDALSQQKNKTTTLQQPQ